MEIHNYMGQKLGYKQTEEAKRNMSVGKIGNKNALGKHWKLSEESKKKISLAKIGKPRSDETKKKLSEANKGKHLSEETKKKISDFHKGNKYCLGHKISEETRKKLSEGRRGKSTKAWAVKGEKHHNWKGGITLANLKIRNSDEYKQWRIKVFERDNYKCLACGRVGGSLTAHHIKKFSDYTKLRFDINNGATLCDYCHSLTDNYKSKST